MRRVIIGELYKVELVGVWGRDDLILVSVFVCELWLCCCWRCCCLGCWVDWYFFLFIVLESGLTGFFLKFLKFVIVVLVLGVGRFGVVGCVCC